MSVLNVYFIDFTWVCILYRRLHIWLRKEKVCMVVNCVPNQWSIVWRAFQLKTFQICYHLYSLPPRVRYRNIRIVERWNLIYIICMCIWLESLDSVSELPKSVNQQLQHLAKSRPKRAKTRAPSRSHIRNQDETDESGTLDTFFKSGSVTPSTTTPLISPNSDDRYLSVLLIYRI